MKKLNLAKCFIDDLSFSLVLALSRSPGVTSYAPVGAAAHRPPSPLKLAGTACDRASAGYHSFLGIYKIT